MLANLAFQHLNHEAIYRAADSCNLLKYPKTLVLCLYRCLQSRRLAMNSPYPRSEPVLVLDCVRHSNLAVKYRILGYSIYGHKPKVSDDSDIGPSLAAFPCIRSRQPCCAA